MRPITQASAPALASNHAGAGCRFNCSSERKMAFSVAARSRRHPLGMSCRGGSADVCPAWGVFTVERLHDLRLPCAIVMGMGPLAGTYFTLADMRLHKDIQGASDFSAVPAGVFGRLDQGNKRHVQSGFATRQASGMTERVGWRSNGGHDVVRLQGMVGLQFRCGQDAPWATQELCTVATPTDSDGSRVRNEICPNCHIRAPNCTDTLRLSQRCRNEDGRRR